MNAFPEARPGGKIFSLDYDGTASDDPTFWAAFAKIARTRGHEVYLVTMRYESELGDIEKELIESVTAVIPTGRKAKKRFCEDHEIGIDVWIDDCPEFVYLDALPNGPAAPEPVVSPLIPDLPTEIYTELKNDSTR